MRRKFAERMGLVSKRVLVVDDDQDGRSALRALLEPWGYRVEDADSADDGVLRARTFQPAVVILDLGLNNRAPDFEVVRRIRDTVGSGARVIVYSGYGDLELPRAKPAATTSW